MLLQMMLLVSMIVVSEGAVVYPKVSGNPSVSYEGLKMIVNNQGPNTFRYHYGAVGLCTEDYDDQLTLKGYAILSVSTSNDTMLKQRYSDIRCKNPVGTPATIPVTLETATAGDEHFARELIELVQKINNGFYDFKEYASGDCHAALEVNPTDTVRSVASGSTLLPLHPNICVRSEIDEIGVGSNGAICIKKQRFSNDNCEGTPTNVRTKLYNICFNKDHSTFADFVTFKDFTGEDVQRAICLHAVVDPNFRPSNVCGDIAPQHSASVCNDLKYPVTIKTPPSGSPSDSDETSAAVVMLIIILIFLGLTLLYCVVGAAWRYHHGGKGWDLIPHMESIRGKGWFQVVAQEPPSELDFVEDESTADLPATPLDAIDDTDIGGEDDGEDNTIQ